MITHHYFVVCVAGLALGTIAIRGSFVALSGKLKISDKLRELFTFIPAAILPGLIIPATYYHHGKLEMVQGKERFMILLMTIGLAYFVRNTLVIIGFGLVLLYLLTLSV